MYKGMFSPNVDLMTLISTKCLPHNMKATIDIFQLI